MHIVIVVAMSENRAIGKDNQLLWQMPADLQHFKKITMGKPILMGRKTYQSIGRPLPGRTNVIITRDENFKAEGCLVVNSIESALAVVKDQEEICVIGGADLFRQMLPMVERIYLTVVHHEFEDDTFFPELDLAEWRELEKISNLADEKNKYPYDFLILQKKRVSNHDYNGSK